MGKFDRKVVFITGAARGQGRSHAVRFAEEGADVIAVDVCRQLEHVEYAMSTPEDLEETALLVEKAGRRIVARIADVRDRAEMQGVVDEGMSTFGRLDFVLANAGVMPLTLGVADHLDAWTVAVDVMLTGVFHTIEVAIPPMVDAGNGGSIVITSSTAGLKGLASTRGLATPGFLGYSAAKHGVVGLMRCYANALAPHSIRVNTVHPTGTRTPMCVNEQFESWATVHQEIFEHIRNALPVDITEPEDISNAMAWLCSDEARYVTGTTLPVDAGMIVRV
jgi:SDR family mycofactocin-dependent oxidoreductase